MTLGYISTELDLVAAFLFVAVWVLCCTSDIVFPLLFAWSCEDEGQKEGADDPAERATHG